jgi:hypothetical protein
MSCESRKQKLVTLLMMGLFLVTTGTPNIAFAKKSEADELRDEKKAKVIDLAECKTRAKAEADELSDLEAGNLDAYPAYSNSKCAACDCDCISEINAKGLKPASGAVVDCRAVWTSFNENLNESQI